MARTYKTLSSCRLNQVPSSAEYVAGLRRIQSHMSELQMQLLQKQYSAPNRSVTAPELAKLTNATSYSVVNLFYGKLGDLFCKETGLKAAKGRDNVVRWWTVWSIGYNTHEGFVWEMHSEVAEALEILGWVKREQPELDIQRQQVEAEGYFDATNLEDARQRATVSIVQRQGQGEFRRKLLRAYNYQCPVTGCNAEPALEAAHIVPYLGLATNHITNGLLLRADIHTLFDLHLLSIQPKTHEIVLAPELVSMSYKKLIGRKLSPPKEKAASPDQTALINHHELFMQRCGESHHLPAPNNSGAAD